MEPIALEPVDALTITTLVDNMTDVLLADSGPAKRAPFALAAAGAVLRAEHGFSCLVTITKAARTTRILFDAGITTDGLIENMRRLEISPGDIDIIVLSHGHWDHTTGMHGIVRRTGPRERPRSHPSRVLEPPAGRAARPRSGRAALHEQERPARERALTSWSSSSRRSCSTVRCW